MRTEHPEPARLLAFFERTLADADARGIEEHLPHCDTCAAHALRLLLGSGVEDAGEPDELWAGIQRRLSAAAVTRRARFPMSRARTLAAVVIVLIITSALWFARGAPPQAPALAIGAYLADLERSSAASDIERLRARFEGVVPYDRDQALAEGHVRPNVDRYRLVEQLSWPGGRGANVVQLLYASGTDAFAVFVAPPGSVGAFGAYDVVDARVAGRLCRRVTCPREDVYLWADRRHDYVFVRRHTAANSSERLFGDLVDGLR